MNQASNTFNEQAVSFLKVYAAGLQHVAAACKRHTVRQLFCLAVCLFLLKSSG